MSFLDDINDRYDVVVVGTGALARVGQSVLHLDSNEYYGEAWGSLTMNELRERVGLQEKRARPGDEAVTPSTDAELEALLPSGTKLVKSKAGPGIALHEVEEGIHVQEKPPQFLNCYTPACRAAYNGRKRGRTKCHSATCAANLPPPPSWDGLLKDARRYILDLTPKLCLSKGSLEAFMHTGAAILEVPCSKKTLLLNKNLAAKEKRQLMKLLQSCMATPPAEPAAPTGEAATLAKKYKFSQNVCNYVIHAIAGVKPGVDTNEGMDAVRR
eukprot:gene2546-28810_t